jgi:hypothetical protein
MVEFVLNKTQPSFILYCKINGAIFDVNYTINLIIISRYGKAT